MKKVNLLRIEAFILTILFMCFSAWAVPIIIDYQGVLLDDEGIRINVNGSEDTTFSIYDAAIDGNLLWMEQQTVSYNDGYFSVELGSVTSLPTDLFDQDVRYLEIFIPDTVTTRKALNSKPYAIKANDADTLGGEEPLFYAGATHTHEFTEFTGEVSDAQVPDSITIDNAGIAGFALKAGDANTVDGKHAHEFLDTSANTQTKTGGVNINGNVGIGTTTPQSLLNIDSGGNYPVVIRGDADRSGANTVLLALQGYWDGTRVAGFDLQTGSDTINKDAGRIKFRTAEDALTGLKDRLTIDEYGNVGIGTTTPQSLLNIDSGGNYPVVIRGDADRSSAGTVLLALQGYWDGTRVAGFDLQTGSDTVNKDAGSIKFRTAENAVSGLQDRMVIDEEGNVGIGTTNPNNKIQVNGLINFDDDHYSTFIGYLAGNSNTGSYNMANGYLALYSNTTGYSNIANGYCAMYSNTSGYSNTTNGYYALYSNTTGSYNTANGYRVLYTNSTGGSNTAYGFSALYSNTTGNYNTASGDRALYSNTLGSFNTANGFYALYSNTTANYNTANGYCALYTNSTGRFNTALGSCAGLSNRNGSGNMFLGFQAGYFEEGSNKLYIANSSENTLIYGDFSEGYVGIGTTDPQGTLDVNGSIYQRGSELYADYVFESGYKLESIKEHAEFMWREKHLKAIPKAKADHEGREIIEVGAHRRGVVEELEKAHIYIEQLHKRNMELEKRLEAVEALLEKFAKP